MQLLEVTSKGNALLQGEFIYLKKRNTNKHKKPLFINRKFTYEMVDLRKRPRLFMCASIGTTTTVSYSEYKKKGSYIRALYHLCSLRAPKGPI